MAVVLPALFTSGAAWTSSGLLLTAIAQMTEVSLKLTVGSISAEKDET